MTRVLIPPIAQPPIPAEGTLARLHGVAMGTSWSVLAYGADPAALTAAITASLDQVIRP